MIFPEIIIKKLKNYIPFARAAGDVGERDDPGGGGGGGGDLTRLSQQHEEELQELEQEHQQKLGLVEKFHAVSCSHIFLGRAKIKHVLGTVANLSWDALATSISVKPNIKFNIHA